MDEIQNQLSSRTYKTAGFSILPDHSREQESNESDEQTKKLSSVQEVDQDTHPEHSQKTSKADFPSSRRSRSKSKKKEKRDKADKKKSKSKERYSKKSKVSRLSARMSEWKSQVGGVSDKSKMINPSEDDMKTKAIVVDREQLILDETRKELLQLMVKSKDEQDLNFQTPEELNLKYENQLLKTKVAELDKKINDMRLEGKRDSENYQVMKQEYKSMKKLMKERKLKLDDNDSIEQDEKPKITPKAGGLLKLNSIFANAMTKNIQGGMDKHFNKTDEIRDCPLVQYKAPSSKVKFYNSRRQKNYDDSDEDTQVSGKVTFDDGNDGSIEYSNNQGKKYSIPGNTNFSSYKTMFQDLIKQTEIVTMYDIISMIISYDSTRAITVTKKDETTSYIKMYCLKEYTLKFEEEIVGTNVKVKEVEQNFTGTYFAVCYHDDGKFRLRTFGKQTRTKKIIEQDELKINEQFGLDDYTMPNDDFNDPCMNCCFISDNEIFVSFFHNYSRTHCHFVWNYKTKRIRGSPSTDETERYHVPVSKVLDCNIQNFPYKCFYNEEENEIYQFYRQGHSFTINPVDLEQYRFERITELDLGQMVFFGNKALITRSSSKILFFKQKKNIITDKIEWTLYHKIKARGFIYFIKGNIRIQVVTEELIYFYLIDFKDFMPELENVMYNFMGCNQMMFGKRVRNCITYKENQRSFDVYQRKFMHNLRVCVDSDDYQGQKGVVIPTQDVFMTTAKGHLKIFDSSTFKLARTIPVPLLPTETREINQIIGIEISQNDNVIAVISGKNLVMNEQKQNQLFIFKMKETKRREHNFMAYPEYILFKRIVVKDIPVFNKVCMQYSFKKTQYISDDPDTLIFCKADIIFELNFEQEKINIIYKIPTPFTNQPNFFVTNKKQDVFVLASVDEAIYVDIKARKFIDLDQKFGVQEIKAIIFDEQDGVFYFLANKKDNLIGFYLIQFDQYNIDNFSFLIAFKNKLNIGDANISLIRDVDQQVGHYKELVLGYKTININTYTTVVYDLSGDPQKRATLQKHECFQLWESEVSGLLLLRSKDYITFSKTGINVLALGSNELKPLNDNEGQKKMIHSLDSLSYLKIEAKNYINFQCQNYNNRVISIEQEWHRCENGKIISTHYDEIYKIKIHEITLRELLILESFYICGQQSEISDLVTLQPKPQFFYKTFLELGGANMASILAFDSRSMNYLLSSQNEKYFSEEFPIIYKNKAFKKDGASFYYTNALKYALKNNQVGAVNSLIDYCCKYQNNSASSYLMVKIVPKCLDLGVSMTNLFQSNIFLVNFDFDDWPGNHNFEDDCIRPYSGSLFDIRFQYRNIFPEDHFEPIETQKEEVPMSKINKITYSINLFPQVDKHVDIDGVIRNKDNEILALCEKSEELEIFDCQTLNTYIKYKWDTFGYDHHKFGLNMHLFYVFTLCVYVNQAYNKEDAPGGLIWNVLLATGIIYPTYYCGTGLRYLGFTHYFSHPANYVDLTFILASGANCLFQLVLGPRNILCKSLMIVIVMMSITRTFGQLRIYPSLAPIVVMLKTVIYDLKAFLFTLLILIFFFANTFVILGIGLDPEHPMMLEMADDETDRRMLAKKKTASGTADDDLDVNKLKFKQLGIYFGAHFNSLLLQMGDFETALEMSKRIGKFENYVFWFIWLAMVVISCIIFLNFIIAEASASYSKVTETLVSVIEKNKCALLRECEEMASAKDINSNNCPKYLICRHCES